MADRIRMNVVRYEERTDEYRTQPHGGPFFGLLADPVDLGDRFIWTILGVIEAPASATGNPPSPVRLECYDIRDHYDLNFTTSTQGERGSRTFFVNADQVLQAAFDPITGPALGLVLIADYRR